MRGRHGPFAAAVVALGLAAGALSAPAWGDTRQSTIDPAAVRGSITYLRQTFGVSEAEALRRLRLQDTAEGLAERLAKDAAGSYAGMAIDHGHGGRLVVSATSPDVVTRLLAGTPDRAHISVKRVDRSLAQLVATKQRLAGQLGAGPDSAYLPEIAEDTNQVVVWRRDWVPAAARAEAVPAGDGVVVRPLVKPNPLATPNVDVGFCHPLYCLGYGPMRGGLRLDVQRDDGTWGGCTSGFNVRAKGGAHDGKAFVLTAGHCVVGGRHQRLDDPFHNGNPVLVEDRALAMNNYPLDFAVLPYVDAPTARKWLDGQRKHNLVRSFCRNGPFDNGVGTRCVDGNVGIRTVRTFEQVHTGLDRVRQRRRVQCGRLSGLVGQRRRRRLPSRHPLWSRDHQGRLDQHRPVRPCR